ncbi:hypothetical protein Tco_0010332 [Tanacetum coccineum]
MIAPSSSRYSSNDMVHNHYLEEAKKKLQESGRNSRPSVMPFARSQSTTNGSKPKPRINNQNSRNWPASKSSCVPTRKLFTSSTTTVDSEPPHGSNTDITNLHECIQNLDSSAGNPQAKDCKIRNIIQKYEKFSISSEETFDNGLTWFNAILTSLRSLDQDYSNKNNVRKILPALPLKWWPKVTNLPKLPLEELFVGIP